MGLPYSFHITERSRRLLAARVKPPRIRIEVKMNV
jgi:hypothetical protein